MMMMVVVWSWLSMPKSFSLTAAGALAPSVNGSWPSINCACEETVLMKGAAGVRARRL